MIFSEYLQKFPFLYKEKTRTNIGSLREGAVAKRLRENARLAFSFFFRFDENLQAVFSLNLNLSPKVRNNKIKSEIHGQAKPRLSAVFQSRWLLPSRLRVPPSSRRKAYFTRCGAAEEKCADFGFWSLDFCPYFFCGTRGKITLIHGSLAVRAATAERVRN